MSDIVLTPGGYRPRSMVHVVGTDHFVRARAELLELENRATGKARSVGALVRRDSAQPLMPANSSVHGAAAGIAPLGTAMHLDGWISWVGWKDSSGHPIESFSSEWSVPDEPARKGEQTIFLFNGIQNSSMIYQPVLQWGVSAAGGGPRWSVACWYVGPANGHAFCSPLTDVNPGDRLQGVMELVDRNGAAFSYRCRFTGLPDAVLAIFNVEELTWANETLEAYKVTERVDLPASEMTAFSNINLACAGHGTPVKWDPSNPYAAAGCIASAIVDSGTAGRVEVRYG